MEDKYIIIIIMIPVFISLIYLNNKIEWLENRIQYLEKDNNEDYNDDFEEDNE